MCVHSIKYHDVCYQKAIVQKNNQLLYIFTQNKHATSFLWAKKSAF